MYQKFIITFVFVNGNLSSQEAVSKVKNSRSRSDYMQQGTIPSKIDLIFQQAIDKMKVISRQRTLNAFFKVITNVRDCA